MMDAAACPSIVYQMCHQQKIIDTASDLANKLFSRNNILEDVLDQLLTTAVTQREYTRSLANVVRLIVQELSKKKTSLGTTFRDQVNDISVATFLNYWKNSLECDPDYDSPEETPIHPLAICAFIGDLTSLGLLPFRLFRVLMYFLMNRMKTRLHIESIYTMLSHAAAHSTPMLSHTFLYDCRAIVKNRCKQYMWPVQPIEEKDFSNFVLYLIDREPGSKFSMHYNAGLNLEDALMSSVCVGSILQC